MCYSRIRKLETELEAANMKVRDMEEQMSSKNPGYVSILIRRIGSLLNGDNHMIWKVLQENMGGDWFHPVFTERNFNHKYQIDYETIDQLVPKLNRIVVKNNPSDISKLASGTNPMLLNILIDIFQEQKLDLEKEIYRIHERDFQYSNNISLAKQPSSAEIENGDNSLVGEKSGQATSRNVEDLKRKITMLLNELRNVKAEKINISQSLAAVTGQFNIFEGFVHELAETAGIPKESFVISQLLGKTKKLDQKLLAQNGFVKVIAQGKLDLIARLNVVVVLFSSG